MKDKILILTLIILYCSGCTNNDVASNMEESVQTETKKSTEDRRLMLQQKSDDGTISTDEQMELDSLDIENYKKELEESVLQMIEDNH